MKKIKFFAIAMAAMMTLGLTSCKGDDEIPYSGTTINEGDIIKLAGNGADDTQASYELRFSISLKDGNIVVAGLPDTARVQGSPDYYVGTDAAIVDMGKVNGLNKLDEYPEDKEFTTSTVPAAEKHGYIIRAKANGDLYLIGSERLHDPKTQYGRLWIEEANGEGFNIRYEYPFVAE